jgi:hypothetical protein
VDSFVVDGGSVSGVNDLHDQFSVVDGVDDAIVADAQAAASGCDTSAVVLNPRVASSPWMLGDMDAVREASPVSGSAWEAA